jgi:hypothetical protein
MVVFASLGIEGLVKSEEQHNIVVLHIKERHVLDAEIRPRFQNPAGGGVLLQAPPSRQCLYILGSSQPISPAL